jgi:ribosome recycling factor
VGQERDERHREGDPQLRAGLNPSNDGNIIRVPIPALNEERRREMVKVLHRVAEEGRIAVRHARQEANKEHQGSSRPTTR